MRTSCKVLVLVGLAAAACNPRRHVGNGGAHAADGSSPPRAHATVPDAGQDPCATLTAEQRGTVVARVGSSTLTLCDFAQRINLQNQYLRARFQAPEQRRALLRSWVDSELLAVEARNRGFDRDPSVQHAIVSQLARLLETEVRAGVTATEVSDADILAYYTQHGAEYDTPEQVRAAHIVVGSRDRAERVLAEVRAHATDDAFWREAVRRETADGVTRETAGDLGFFGPQGGSTVAHEVAAAAFAMHQIGEISAQVVESAHGGPNHAAGFHVVRFVARRDALHRSLDAVRSAIRNRLWRERFDRAQDDAVRGVVERLRAQTPIQIDESVLAQIHLDLPNAAGSDGGAPPALSR